MAIDGFVIEPTEPEIDRAASIICGHDAIYKSLDQETAGNFHMFVQEVLRTTVGEEINRLKAERLKLDKRIRNQRLALRDNWETIEMRASHRRAWYPSPLLRSILSNRRKNPPWWRRMMTRAIFGTSANEQLRRVFHS